MSAPPPRRHDHARSPGHAPVWVAVALCGLCCLLAACSDETPDDTKDTSGAADVPFGGIDSQLSDVGPSGCSGDADCPQGTHCKLAAGQTSGGACVVCVTDTQCDSGQVCSGDICVAADCKNGEVTCQDIGHLGTCKDGQWAVTACGDGAVCEAGSCKSKVCSPGAKQCTGDLKAVQTCGARGASWSTKPCQIDEACVASACVKHQCQPGKKTCGGDGASVLTCKADGQGQDVQACAQGQGCDPGYGTAGAQASCKAWICEPGQLFCDGLVAKKCDAGGLEATQVDNCNKNDSLGKPMTCKDGACLSVKCTPGSQACLGWTLIGKCKSDGSGYSEQSCGKDLVCKEGTCKPQTCAPGEAFCEGAIAKQCDKVGTGVSVIGDCAAGGLDCFEGKCVKQICTAGAKQCSADGTALEVCGQGGYAWLGSPCAKGQVCEGGACKPVVCTPGEGKCEGNKATACSAGGTAWSAPADCGKKVCVDGACKAKDCPAGTTSCKDSTTQLVCNANSVGGTEKACPKGQICKAGQCKAAVCIPDKAWCEGTVGKKCASDGLSLVSQVDCKTFNQNCKEGGCVDKGCGDGTCDKAAGETCTSCAKDCGACPFDGCTAKAQAGCGGCACESCVCQLDPTCCSGTWSGFCANLCKTACGGTCP